MFTGAVQEQLGSEPPLAYTTVQTMLNVLHRRRKAAQGAGGQGLRVPGMIVTHEAAVRHAVREMLDHMFGGSVDGLLMNLLKDRQISKEKLNE